MSDFKVARAFGLPSVTFLFPIKSNEKNAPALKTNSSVHRLFWTCAVCLCLFFCASAHCDAQTSHAKVIWEDYHMGDESRECTWENFRREKRRSKLDLDSKVYPGFENAKAYETTYFDNRMYIYGAYKHSNIEGPNSAVVIWWLLRYADQLDRGQAPNFGAVLSDVNSRVQRFSIEEQNNALTLLATYPSVMLHTDRELNAIPLVYTVLALCDKPGIEVDKDLANRLRCIERNFCGSWEQVTPDSRRNKCVLDVTKKSVELFEKLDPKSKLAVIAHEHLARVFDDENQKGNESGEYLKVLQLNLEGVRGEVPPASVLRMLMELYISEHRYTDIYPAFKKYSKLLVNSSEVFHCAKLLQAVVRTGANSVAVDVGPLIFSYMDFEGPAPPPPPHPNELQQTGCGRDPKCYSQPSWYLSGWLRLIIDSGDKMQAQKLYDQCISAAREANKQRTKEFQLSVDCADIYSLKKSIRNEKF